MTQDTHREPYSPNTPQSRLETIQALLLLFVIGLWGAKAILHEALSLQSRLALLVREEGLVAEPNQATEWETWVRLEATTRTKLIAYCFFNLCSIAYMSPPLLLTSEVHLFLPSPSRVWRAQTAWEWQDVRQSYPQIEISLQDAFIRLLNRPSQGPPSPVSSLGNYVLIHALNQHIFLLKQTSFISISPFEVHRGLKPQDVEEVVQAMRMWSHGFEQHRQLRASEAQSQAGPGLGEGFTGGPIAFNSYALMRLAVIRLHTDASLSRGLETRNHAHVASSFLDSPLVVRGPSLSRAVLQAIHALSMLVKAGVNYVGRTKATEWSMQHSLCNLECAVLLAKWLMTFATTEQPATEEEKGYLGTVRRMLDETEFAVPIDPSLSGGHNHQHHSRAADMATSDHTKIRQLAAAVLRLWAETFKGVHCFEIVRIMASGLEAYADLIEKPRDRTPLGTRLGSNSGLG